MTAAPEDAPRRAFCRTLSPMDQQSPASGRQSYWNPYRQLDGDVARMACPRQCGRYMTGTKDGQLVKWECGCGYHIHS